MESFIQEALFNHQLSPITLVAAFISGLLTSLTPCVYPMFPITASIVGSNASTKTESFTLSLTYVTGLASIYASLGMLAALTGSLFGSIASNPITLILVGFYCLLMAAWMLNLINVPSLPIIKSNKIQNKRISLFTSGAISGLVMAPCTSPVLGMVLMYVGANGSLLWGAALLFVFSIGMSLLLVLVGSISGLVSQLTKPGGWLNMSKYLLSSLMCLAAIYFFYLAF